MNTTTSELSFDKQDFTYLFYGGQDQYEKFTNLKKLRETLSLFHFEPENYAFSNIEQIKDEANMILEIIKLHKQKKLNLTDTSYISELTQHSRVFEIHSVLFKTLALIFSNDNNNQILRELIDNYNILGTVLLQELDYKSNKVSNEPEVIFN